MPKKAKYSLATCVLCLVVGCRLHESEVDSRAKVISEHEKLRNGSVRAWTKAQIDQQHAFDYVTGRTATQWDQAERLELRRIEASEKMKWVGVTASGREIGQVSSAVPVAAEGYFLTAAHCVKSGLCLLVCPRENRPPLEITARVIWRGAENCDLAILHAAVAEPLPYLDWSMERPKRGAAVLVCGAGATSIRLAGGTVTSVTPPDVQPKESADPSVPRVHQIVINAPLLPGDSGGPAILSDGSLVGIAVSTSAGRIPKSVVLRPDPDWVASLIKAHRATQTNHRPSVSEISTTGFLRLGQQQAELDALRNQVPGD